MNVTTKTRIIIGASAYASISYTCTTADAHYVGTIDMKLPGGRSASADLRRIADEHRERAAREMRCAVIADNAATELEIVRLTTEKDAA
jgi:hypothetical protein